MKVRTDIQFGSNTQDLEIQELEWVGGGGGKQGQEHVMESAEFDKIGLFTICFVTAVNPISYGTI